MTARHVALLRAELDRAAGEGRSVEVWWRDDDAVRATPALDRLLALSRASGIPLALAAIPARVEPSLARRVAAEPGLRVLPHGWTHADHAPAGAKPSEFGPHRPLAARRDEVRRARETVRELFGTQALDLFVPPWNRIDPALAAALPDLGYLGVSAFGAAGGSGPRGLPANLDPVAWRGSRSLAAPEILARMLGGGLARGEPVGLLTHHLVFDDALWDFTDAVLALVSRHPAVTLRPAEALLPVPAACRSRTAPLKAAPLETAA